MIKIGFFTKDKKESDYDKKLREQKEKLALAEISDEVIDAVKLNRILLELSETCNTQEELEDRLRMWAGQQGMKYEDLKKDLDARNKLKLLKGFTTEDVDKLESMYKSKATKNLLEGPK